MYRLYFINADYFSAETFENVEAALGYGANKGFECNVQDEDGVVASWTRFGGVRWFRG